MEPRPLAILPCALAQGVPPPELDTETVMLLLLKAIFVMKRPWIALEVVVRLFEEIVWLLVLGW